MSITAALALFQVAAITTSKAPAPSHDINIASAVTVERLAAVYPAPSRALMAAWMTPLGDIDFSADLWEAAAHTPTERLGALGPSYGAPPTDMGRASFGFAYRF